MGYIWRNGQWQFALSTQRDPVNYHYVGTNPLWWHYWHLDRHFIDVWRREQTAEMNALLKQRRA